MEKSRSRLVFTAVHVLCLAPLALLVIEYYVGRLGPNPIREIQLRTGSYTLFLLVASLACTPMYTLTGISRVLDLRRVLGLYAFSYAALHFMNLVGLDYQFDFEALWRDIAEKRYILAGFPAFLVLLILAITSTTGWKRRLGKNWKRLHRLVYLAGVLAVLHYFWQVKVSVPGPTVYAAILVVLLLLRLPVAERLAARRLPWRTS
jgi:sulfoxide reductase heme-binding subunit YedZ